MTLSLAGIPHYKKAGVQAAMDCVVAVHGSSTRVAARISPYNNLKTPF
jgi:hypothetical protein